LGSKNYYWTAMNRKIASDVIVLGGGPAGVAAAAAAASSGLRVTLIEKNSFLGGNATAAEVGTICGLYRYSKKQPPEYMAGRFAKNFAEALKEESGTEPLYHSSGLHYLPYHIEVFKKRSMDLLRQSGVDIVFDAQLNGVKINQQEIESVGIEVNGESISLAVSTIIDCSGSSSLSQLAGLPLIKSDKYQAAAQVFSMEHIGQATEANLSLILMKELRMAVIEKKLAPHFERVVIVPGSLRDHGISLKIGIPITVTGSTENLVELQKAAHVFVHALSEFLISEVPIFKNAHLGHIAPQVGIRVGMRTVGKYILTEEDVLQCAKFPDSIAKGSWPIEEWGQDRRMSMRYFAEEDHYQIPARCLISASMDNLFTAGRCISATDGAIASARVMGICLQTGYAAGRLAASKVCHLPLERTVLEIQEEY